MIKKSEKRATVFLYIVFFLLFGLIMYLTPHTIDDTYYDYLNLKSIHDIFKFAVGYGNGRILGNCLAIILCKSALLEAVVKSAVITLIVFFLYKITDESSNYNKNINIFTVSAFYMAAILLVSPLMFGEDFAWISAFSNYVPPALLILVNLYIFYLFRNNKVHNKILALFFTAAVSCVCQLFSENCSVYNIVLPIAIIIVLFIIDKSKLKSVKSQLAVWTVFSLLGFFIMMYTRIYLYDDIFVVNVKSYSGIHLKSIKDILTTVVFNLYNISNAIRKNHFLYVVISALMIYLLNSKRFSDSKHKKFKTILSLYLAAFPIYNIADASVYDKNGLNNLMTKMQYAHLFIFCFLAGLYILAIFISALYIKEKEVKAQFLFYYIFALFTIGSLILLTPIGPRCFFVSYIFLILSGGILIKYCLKEKFINSSVVKASLSGIVALIFVFLVPMYASFAIEDQKMAEYARYQIEQNHAQSITLVNISDNEYFHASDMILTYGFTYYDKSPKDVKINGVRAGEWNKNYYKNGKYKQDHNKKQS